MGRKMVLVLLLEVLRMVLGDKCGWEEKLCLWSLYGSGIPCGLGWDYCFLTLVLWDLWSLLVWVSLFCHAIESGITAYGLFLGSWEVLFRSLPLGVDLGVVGKLK